MYVSAIRQIESGRYQHTGENTIEYESLLGSESQSVAAAASFLTASVLLAINCCSPPQTRFPQAYFSPPGLNYKLTFSDLSTVEVICDRLHLCLNNSG